MIRLHSLADEVTQLEFDLFAAGIAPYLTGFCCGACARAAAITNPANRSGFAILNRIEPCGTLIIGCGGPVELPERIASLCAELGHHVTWSGSPTDPIQVQPKTLAST